VPTKVIEEFLDRHKRLEAALVRTAPLEWHV
jgi:hypothetical protein